MTILQVIRNFHLVLTNNECSNFGQTKNDVCSACSRFIAVSQACGVQWQLVNFEKTVDTLILFAANVCSQHSLNFYDYCFARRIVLNKTLAFNGH